MTLDFFPARKQWAFISFRRVVRLYDRDETDFPLFYDTRSDAVAAIESCGLKVGADNEVYAPESAN